MRKQLTLRVYDPAGNTIRHDYLAVDETFPHQGIMLDYSREPMMTVVGVIRVDLDTIDEEEIRRPLPPVVYELPGAPPTGRRVRSHTGDIFRRELCNAEEDRLYGPWGCWVEIPTGERWGWIALLRQRGPLFLMELTDQEIKDEVLYGPIGARWGFPDQPCPYRDAGRIHPDSRTAACVLGRGHIGPHIDKYDQELGLDRDFNPDKAADPSAVWCTCGQPGLHLPHCPRYQRLTGE